MISGLFWLLPGFSVNQVCVLNKAEISSLSTQLSVLQAAGIPLKKVLRIPHEFTRSVLQWLVMSFISN